jgi:hypothetical protein
MKVYECWPKDGCRKGELLDWCEEMFGAGNVDYGWSVTSHYDQRPFEMFNDRTVRNPCPFLFRTTDPKKLTLFKLKFA